MQNKTALLPIEEKSAGLKFNNQYTTTPRKSSKAQITEPSLLLLAKAYGWPPFQHTPSILRVNGTIEKWRGFEITVTT